MVAYRLQVLGLTFLRGPNRWSYKPVLEAKVDIHELEQVPSNLRPDVVERLLSLLPGLRQDGCSYGEPGGFVRRLEEGTWPAHIWEHVTLELMRCSGFTVSFGRARSAGLEGQYHVVVGNPNDAVVLRCFELARALLLALYRAEPFDLVEPLEALKDEATRSSVHQSTARVLASARRGRIPVWSAPGSELLVLGQGRRQRRIWLGETDRTSAIASGIAADEELAFRRLQECGLRTVARAVATDEAGSVSIEPPVRGLVYRALVVSDHVVGVIRERELTVQGNGRSPLRDLVASALADLLHGPWGSDPQGLAEQALSSLTEAHRLKRLELAPEQVLAPGQELSLRLPLDAIGERSRHPLPTVDDLATRCARALGLDVATVDMATVDMATVDGAAGDIATSEGPAPAVAESAWEIQAVRPGLVLDAFPVDRGLREDPVADALLTHLMPGDGARIPVTLVSGRVDVPQICEGLALFLARSGKFVCRGTAESAGIGETIVRRAHLSHADQVQLLLCPLADAAVLQVTPEALLREGLATDRCSVAVVTDVDVSEMERLGLTTPESQLHLLRTLVDVVLPGGVAILNAAVPAAVSLAGYCDGKVLLYGQSDLPELTRHRDGGGATLAWDGQTVTYQDGALQVSALVPEHPWSLEVWLPAVAAGVVAGVDLRVLLGTLATSGEISRNSRESRQVGLSPRGKNA